MATKSVGNKSASKRSRAAKTADIANPIAKLDPAGKQRSKAKFSGSLTNSTEGFLAQLASYYTNKSSVDFQAVEEAAGGPPSRVVKDAAVFACLNVELSAWRSETYRTVGMNGTMEEDYELVFEEFGPFLLRVAARLAEWHPPFLFEPEPSFVRENGDKTGNVLAGRIASATRPLQ